MSEGSPRTEQPQDEEVARVIRDGALEPLTAPEILSWAVEKFHPRLALSASFGEGKERQILAGLAGYVLSRDK